jgi:hypothetical protein
MATVPRPHGRRRLQTAVLAAAATLLAGGGLAAAAPPRATAPAPATAAAAGTPLYVPAYEACLAATNLTGNAPASAYVAGYSNVLKLDNAAIVGFPDLALAHTLGTDEVLKVGGVTVPSPQGPDNFTCSVVRLQLDHQGRREFPSIRATFLGFGFMPVTATVHLTQAGPPLLSDCPAEDGTTRPECVPILVVVFNHTRGPTGPIGSFQVVTVADVSLRLSDVTVNGEPLDVGDDCRSTGSLSTPDSPVESGRLVLTGGNQPADPTPQYAAIAFGGALAGAPTIPPLTGCNGADEDLDPLFNAVVSGPDNDAKIVQGPLCATIFPLNCTPESRPKYAPIWQVTDGGAFAGTAAGATTVGIFGTSAGRTMTITCARSAVGGSVTDTALRPPRGHFGSVRFSLEGCNGSDGSAWTITQDGDAAIYGALHDPEAGTSYGGVANLSLTLRGTGNGTGVPAGGPPCTATVRGGLTMSYHNPPQPVLAVGRVLAGRSIGSTLTPIETDCADIASGTQVITASYPLSTGTAVITSPVP